MNAYFDDQDAKFLKAKVNIIEYEAGQLVKVRTVGQAGVANQNKLSYAWKGPFAIKEKVRGGYNVGLPWCTGAKSTLVANTVPIPPEDTSGDDEQRQKIP